jgi:hypothetical protein
MGVEYNRIQRESIYHIASIGDIPFEVIQKALRLLGRDDLVSASLSCRAWNQAAAELILAQKRFDNEREMEGFVCGMQLKSIVSGFEQYSIKKLDLEIRRIGIEYIRMLSPIVAPTLSILCLYFQEPAEEEDEESVLECYEVLEALFFSCLQIRCLQLHFYDFGDDPSSLTPTIKDGLRRLISLDVFDCRGDLMMFAELAPIQNLSNLAYDLEAIDSSSASDIISVISMKCRSLKDIHLYASFESWESIHKIVECCRDLEEITFIDYSRHQPLKNSEFVAIASLPRLMSLNLIHCVIDIGAVSPLARCKGLKHLRGLNINLSSDVLRAIGGNLKTLRCKLGLGGLEEIVEYCPNLETLDITVNDEEGNWVNDDALLSSVRLIKNGLKKKRSIIGRLLWEQLRRVERI